MDRKSQMFFILCFGLMSGQVIADKHNELKTHYFKGFYSNYSHPYNGVGEMTVAEAHAIGSYYEAKIDSLGHTLNFKKILNQRCLFEFEYHYSSQGDLVNTVKGTCNDAE